MRTLQQKNEYSKQQQELLSYRNQLKRREGEEKMREREEYNKMCEENARREMNKERQYKQFFNDFDRNMQDRMQQHVHTVLNPEIDKITNTQNWEKKSERDYNTRVEKKIQEQYQQYLKNIHNTNDTIRKQIEYKNMQKNLDGELKQHAQEIRHVMEQRYADDMRRRKEEEREQKRLYSETLKYQRAI